MLNSQKSLGFAGLTALFTTTSGVTIALQNMRLVIAQTSAAAPLKQEGDRLSQLVKGDVFKQIARCPSLEHLGDILWIIKGRQHQHLCIGPLLADLTGACHPISDEHAHIHRQGSGNAASLIGSGDNERGGQLRRPLRMGSNLAPITSRYRDLVLFLGSSESPDVTQSRHISC